MMTSATAPKVSAAITTCNRVDLIGEAVASVLGQTYDDYELLVIDDGSTDGTRDALAPYLDRIRYIYQENRGRAAARNTAIDLARGEYVAFLDSDDAWLPDRLERQVPVLDQRPDVALVHGHVEVVDERGYPLPELTEIHRRLFSEAHRDGASYARYALECRCLTSTAMFRADVLRALGGYDPAIAVEDVDLYLRLTLSYGVMFLEGPPLARYRYHASQTPAQERALGQIQIARKHLAYLDAHPEVSEARLARRNFYLLLSWSHHVRLEPRQTRRYVLEAVALDRSLLRDPRVLKRLAVSLAPPVAIAAARRLRRNSLTARAHDRGLRALGEGS